MDPRKLTDREKRLLHLLSKLAFMTLPEDLLVETMDDGGMGSLLLFPKGIPNQERTFGKIASEYEFKDKDGIPVLASLILDKNGDLFELDVWKVDYSPLIRLPD